MSQLQSGSRNWPILGNDESDWASFAYLWPNYVRIDHKNINNGTGGAAEKEKTRKENLHSILALATQNNAQAREIMESRQMPEGDEVEEPELDGDADFEALKAHFEPKIQVCVGLVLKQLDSCFEAIFKSWETDFNEGIAKLLDVLRKCVYLRCKPGEQQLITKFLSHMPDTGPWGTRKVMWTETTMNNDGTFTGVTLKDIIDKARIAYLQLKESPDGISGVRAFMSRRGAEYSICDICGNTHKGQCWYRNKEAYNAMMRGRDVSGGINRKRKFNSNIRCYDCGGKGHIARDCKKSKAQRQHESESDEEDDSELDEATMRKAKRQMMRKMGKKRRTADVVIPNC